MTVSPTINLNGTSKEALIRGYVDAIRSLEIAAAKLAETAPHGRDYPHYDGKIPSGFTSTLSAAIKDHQVRQERIIATIRELTEIAESL